MKRNFVLIIASCLVGLITAGAYSARLRHLRDDMLRLSERIPVLTVNRNIRAGEHLTLDDISENLILKEQASVRAVPAEDWELIAGRRVIHPIPARDTILWTDFPEGPRLRYPSERIPPGFRLIALPADETHTLVHFISPGDSVDVVSSTFDDSGNRLAVRLIAEKIQVLAVGRLLDARPYEEDSGQYPMSVSLLVDPGKALDILRASQMGEVHFLARGSDPLAGIYDPDKTAAPGIPKAGNP